jgi:hypothetical protein
MLSGTFRGLSNRVCVALSFLMSLVFPLLVICRPASEAVFPGTTERYAFLYVHLSCFIEVFFDTHRSSSSVCRNG